VAQIAVIGILSLMALPHWIAATAATYTANPNGDSFVNEGKAGQNNGTKTELDLKSNKGGDNLNAPIFGFALPAIASGEAIVSASLKLWVTRADNKVASVHRVTDSWTESTVTWTNTGSDFDAASIATFTPSTASAYATIDITSLVQAWYGGTYANEGLIVRTSATDVDIKFTSREWATTTQRPELVITTAPIPALTIVKSSQPYYDPYNGTTNPKLIPGAFAAYTVTVTNTGAYTVSNNSIVITDATPAGMRLFVGNVPGGAGPVLFTAGGSGLAYTYTSLGSTTDDVDFSNNGGSTWTYTPVPNADQVDPNVTHIRIRPRGTMAASSSFSAVFGYQIQ
jgi:uncharacterized repeat protein (TIGR01451 family)